MAKALGLGWDLVNDLAVSEVRAMVYEQPGHFDGVRVLGVDEHKWKHVRGDGSSAFVTVLVDLTPVVDGTGPSRLLDMVPGRRRCSPSGWTPVTRCFGIESRLSRWTVSPATIPLRRKLFLQHGR